MNRTQFVSVRVAHVGEVERAHMAFAQAWWLLDGCAAVGDGGVMEQLHLFRRDALEADGGAIGDGRFLVVDRLADAEDIAVVPIEQAGMAGRCLVASRFAGSESGEDRVVEALRALDVVAADHDVIEHFPSQLPGCEPHGRCDGRRGRPRRIDADGSGIDAAAEPMQRHKNPAWAASQVVMPGICENSSERRPGGTRLGEAS